MIEITRSVALGFPHLQMIRIQHVLMAVYNDCEGEQTTRPHSTGLKRRTCR
jgi:hypothetical protein